MNPYRFVAPCLMVFIAFARAAAQEPPPAPPVPAPDAKAAPTVPPETQAAIDEALRGREYEKAIERIDAALPKAEKGEREYLLFERGLALLYSQKHEEAIKQFTAQLEAFPDGPWAQKARFRIADAHVALKQFDAAERIYEERVKQLVGDDRKARIARVYLDFAQEYFQPKDALIKPDF